MSVNKKGSLVIISSPSGGGKTSICQRLLGDHADEDWSFSISYTTRDIRPGEKEGREYFFVADDRFEQLAVSKFFAEECQVHLYRYGTPREPIDKVMSTGGIMIFDVDVQGAQKLKDVYPDAMTIFILPPSVAALRQRLSARGTETDEQLKVRFDNATREMQLWKSFEYAVVNDDLNTAVKEVESIIISHQCRTDRLDGEQIQYLIS